MITLNRYIMIAHFGIYKSVYRTGWIALMITFCWVFPFCLLLPTLLGKWGRFGMIEALETCSIIDEGGQSPKKVLFGLGFCVPALVIIICYSLIFYVIHRSESRIREHNTRATNGVAPQGPPGASLQPKIPGKVDKEARRKKNEWRITKMVMIIFITFLITYLPITLVKFFDPLARYRALHLLGYVLVYLSCCINPVIYVIMNRQYRKAYESVLLCKNPLTGSVSSHGEAAGMEKNVMKTLANGMTRLSLHSWRMSVLLANNHDLDNLNSNAAPTLASNGVVVAKGSNCVATATTTASTDLTASVASNSVANASGDGIPSSKSVHVHSSNGNTAKSSKDLVLAPNNMTTISNVQTALTIGKVPISTTPSMVSQDKIVPSNRTLAFSQSLETPSKCKTIPSNCNLEASRSTLTASNDSNDNPSLKNCASFLSNNSGKASASEVTITHESHTNTTAHESPKSKPTHDPPKSTTAHESQKGTLANEALSNASGPDSSKKGRINPAFAFSSTEE